MIYAQSHAERVRISVRKKTRPDPKRPGRRIATNYQAVVRDPLRTPKKKARTLGTKNKRVAHRLADDFEVRYREGLVDLWDEDGGAPLSGAPVTCAAAVEEYLEDVQRPNDRGFVIQPSTLRQYAYAVRAFAKWMEETTHAGAPLADVQEHHVKGFAFVGGLSDHTRGTRLKRVQDLLAWCVKRRYLRSSPADGLKPPRTAGKTTHFVPDQLDGFLAFLKERAGTHHKRTPGLLALRRAVVLGSDAGLRLGEICALRWADVDLERRLVHVVSSAEHRTKNGKSRTVPIAGRLVEMLTALKASAPPGADYVLTGLGGRRLNENSVSIAFRTNADLYGLPTEFTFHTTRHTYGTELARGDVGEAKRMAVLGHATARQTQEYSHAAGADARADVDRVFGSGTWGGD